MPTPLLRDRQCQRLIKNVIYRAALASGVRRPAWGALTAVREGRVVELDKSLFHYKPNARWAQAYETLEALLYAP